MTHDEAEARSRELNLELGARGDDRSFYIPVETAPGEWEVEKRTEKKSWAKRILDALLDAPGDKPVSRPLAREVRREPDVWLAAAQAPAERRRGRFRRARCAAAVPRRGVNSAAHAVPPSTPR